MSPYRVLARSVDLTKAEEVYNVFVAQLKKDKEIYIWERYQRLDFGEKALSASELANKPISKSNSILQSRYSISKDVDEIHYRVTHLDHNLYQTTSELYLRLNQCLEGAMNDFCQRNKYEITAIL